MMAVVLTVALALTLALTGCGRKPAANVLLNMLNGQYKNVTVTADKDLENTLRRAVKENRTPEQTAQALEKTLGTTVSFDGLRSARAGDRTFDLVFQTGSDTEAIARQTYTDWNTVFSTLPSARRGLFCAPGGAPLTESTQNSLTPPGGGVFCAPPRPCL